MKTVHKLLLSALFAISLPVLAMDLQQAMSALGSAKSQGLVGEQPNGYLGVVGSSAQAKEIADLINNARKAEYQKLAAKNGIQLSDVEAIAGKKAIEKTERKGEKGRYNSLNFILENAALLTALDHPSHIVCLCSWGLPCLSRPCTFQYCWI